MSANRTIPYGYAVKNGKNIVHPKESKMIRRVFADYLGGTSLLRIAQSLTAEKVEFIPGRSDWNKNRVKRILEDERYLGTDTYPAIIGEDMHRQARAVRDSNNKQKPKSEQPDRLPCAVTCALCDGKMTRRHDERRKKSKDLWICQSPDCRAIVNIDDDALHGEITVIMNRLIENPSLIQPHSIPASDLPLEIRRLQNEVDRELDSFEFDRDRAQKAIFALAAEKYRSLDNRQVKSYMVRAEFEQSEPLSSFMPEFMRRTVQKVRLDAGGSIALVLKNDQIIEGGDVRADSGHDRAGNYTAAAIPA